MARTRFVPAMNRAVSRDDEGFGCPRMRGLSMECTDASRTLMGEADARLIASAVLNEGQLSFGSRIAAVCVQFVDCNKI